MAPPPDPSAAASRAPAQRIGRFALLRTLGRGAQATVWLAHDERLDREVALKLLDASSDTLAIDQWLHEARAVSRMAHPNLVPVFEADQAQGRPYLVFEYVAGPTLAALLRERGGALPAREAVALMLGVLDALALAHERGVVHRDLKPSNVLIDAAGRARVMDFGIAARHDDGKNAGVVCGTPGYISPEAARGAAPQPAMDLFAAGVMLAEMLGGRRLIVERDPFRALARVQSEDLQMPSARADGEALDERLCAIVQRALAREPGQRPRSALSLRQALDAWLRGGATPDPAAAEAAPIDGGDNAEGRATLDFLLRRMKTRADFPALSDAVRRIQHVAASEHENLSTLADEILKDVALTNKLLRMVNSAHYRSAGGAVNTVSRAVALVGFAGIRNMAMSLMLLEHMQDKRHAEQLKEEFLRAQMAATLAHELTPAAREAEESFLAAMFQNLGRLLVEFYFPEEAKQIRTLVRPATARSAALDEATAAQRVLGLTLADVGQGVAKAWGLPDTLQRAMRTPEGAPPPRALPAAGVERQRWLARMATEVADALLDDGGDAPRAKARIETLADGYARALALPPERVASAAHQAQERLAQLAQAMQIQLGGDARARRLLAAEPPPGPDTLDDHTLRASDMAPLEAGAPNSAATGATGAAPDPARVAEVLAQGVQDITAHMVADSFKLNEVLRMILETMMRALGFRRVVFCLRDPKTDLLTGRFGLGEGAQAVAAAIRVPLSRGAQPGTADLFAAVCAKGVDTLIADATQPAIAQRLPAWFTQAIAAPSFLLLPMQMKGAAFGLIYADQAQPGGIALGEKELALLRTLRNQGVMAFRQVG